MTGRRFIFIFVLLFTNVCSAYEVTAVRTADYAPDDTFKKIGIGYFEAGGSGNSSRTQRNFYDSLAYSLQARGFQLIDAAATRDLLIRADLPPDRQLSPNEIMQFSSRFPGRILLQGRIQEVKTERLVETYVQVMIQIHLNDMRSGQKIGEAVLFGRNLEFNTARETMAMAEKAADKLNDLLTKRR